MGDIPVNSVDELISEIRQGRRVLLLDDDDAARNEGVVMVAAEHCSAEDVTFLARRARGLVCLALTEDRCRQLDLPPMVEQVDGEAPGFRLSIEAAQGIDTGISAADRALTVQVAMAPDARPEDIVQPGHIFPLAAVPGGVLNRAGHTEAAVDYARLAGLLPGAVIADVLNESGNIADGADLMRFAEAHGLKVGTIADLVHYRLLNEQTIECVRSGTVETRQGHFQLSVYRDTLSDSLHMALSLGEITPESPTLVRVHARSSLRDMLGTRVPGRPAWTIPDCLEAVAAAGSGVVVLIGREESDTRLLESVDMAIDGEVSTPAAVDDIYNNVGIGSQILRDLGVGKIRLMGAPIKYNAISGFGLEVVEHLEPGSMDKE